MFDVPLIRAATPEDAESLAALAERTFRETFSADNASVDVEAYIRDALSFEHALAELADTANTFLLAVINSTDQPAGYSKLRTGPAEPCVSGPKPIELERIYVDRHALGHGVGAALMRANLEAARSGGYQTLWLGVWERNARAISFYERWGFVTVGDHVFQLGSEAQRDLIMQRSVARSGLA